MFPMSLQLATAVPSKMDPYHQPTWPPSLIPCPARAVAFPDNRLGTYTITADDVPCSLSQVCEHAFRIIRSRRVTDTYLDGSTSDLMHMTYATIERDLYTPTPECPYRGIWAGDYGPNGIEFLLIRQPGRDVLRAERDALSDAHFAYQWERDSVWEWRRKQAPTYRSELMAIKLTGDPNVPRGECSFYVPDLDDSIRVKGQPPLGLLHETVECVRTMVHIASHGFRDGEFDFVRTAEKKKRQLFPYHTTSQAAKKSTEKWTSGWLFLLSPNRLAHYCPHQGHIVLFTRVDVDALQRVT